MKTLEQIKNEVSKENFNYDYESKGIMIDLFWRIVTERYSEERLKEWKEEVKLTIINKWIDLQSMKQSEILKLIDSL